MGHRFDKVLPASRQVIETHDLSLPPFEFQTTGVSFDGTPESAVAS